MGPGSKVSFKKTVEARDCSCDPWTGSPACHPLHTYCCSCLKRKFYAKKLTALKLYFNATFFIDGE